MPGNRKKIGNLAIALAIAAVPTPFVISMLIPATKDFLWVNGPFLIWFLELIALVLGVLSRKTFPGKISIFLSIIISIALMAYLSFGQAAATEIQ